MEVRWATPTADLDIHPSMSQPVAFGGAGPGFFGFFLAILLRRTRFERTKQTSRDRGDVVHRGLERAFVRLRGLGETADFSHELKRRRANLVLGDGRIK